MNTEPRLDLITLRSIREHDPCTNGWRTLTRAVGSDLNTVVSIGDIAHTNGAADALWATRCLPDTLEARRFRVSLIMPAVKRAARHTTDERVHKCVADIERWLAGDDTVGLAAAMAAAYAATRAAAWAAWAAGEARAATGAAEATAWAADAVTRAAAGAAEATAWAAGEARAATGAAEEERELQIADIIALSPRTNATLNNEKENNLQ